MTNKEHEEARMAAIALRTKHKTWVGVGIHLAKRNGGSARSWAATTNSVANGTRSPSHELLLALGIRRKRRRFSIDIPDWMNEAQEDRLRRELREAWAHSIHAIRSSKPLEKK